MKVINLKEKFGLFDEHWHPKIAAELNGQFVKLAKLQGEFVWHHHDEEDELFLVVKGTLRIAFEDGEKVLNEGEMIVVPRGVRHKPIADDEVWVLLFEPQSTLNTGDADDERKRDQLDRI